MRHLLTLSSAVILGLVAAGMNFAYLSFRTAPIEYVRVTTDLKAGEPFTSDLLEPVRISENVSTTAMRYEERSNLYARRAPRNFAKGELVLWQDVRPEALQLQLESGETGLHVPLDSLRYEPGLLRVGDEIGFVVAKPSGRERDGGFRTQPPAPSVESAFEPAYERLGPFRIVSVGEQISAEDWSADANATSSRSSTSGTLTVATRLGTDERSFDGDANRLIVAIRSQGIVGITLSPPRASAGDRLAGRTRASAGGMLDP